MPAETSHYKIKYAVAADETKAFPTEVSKPGAETIDKAIWEGNKVAAEQVYSGPTSRTSATEYEASATRAALVFAEVTFADTNHTKHLISFIVPAGLKWKWTSTANTAKFQVGAVSIGAAKIGEAVAPETVTTNYLLL